MLTLTSERERLQGVFLRGRSARSEARERERKAHSIGLYRAFDRAWPMPVAGASENPGGRAIVSICASRRAESRSSYLRRMTALRHALAGIRRHKRQDEVELVTLSTEYSQLLPSHSAMRPLDVLELCESAGVSVELLTGVGC